MALYQKEYVTRSTICVESFIIVSQSARNAHFLVLCRSTTYHYVLVSMASPLLPSVVFPYTSI